MVAPFRTLITFALKSRPSFFYHSSIRFHMPLQTENWTYAEFHAFVMLYAANTDGHITLEEERLIVPTLSASEYAHIKSIFMACDDAEALDIIFSYKDKYCQTPEAKAQILADMVDIYESSAAFGQIEREVYRLFERLL